jgi:small ligand-binding sensory domain FIST
MMGQLDPFRVAISLEADPIAAVDAVAKELAAKGQGGSVGFVYATDKFKADLGTITDLLRERTGVQHWIGTLGLGVIAGTHGVFDKSALAAMIGTWPESDIKICEDGAGATAPPFGVQDFGLAKAIVHIDPRHQTFDDLLHGFATATGAYVMGGLTASRSRRFDQMAGRPTQGGLSGLFLAPEVDVTIGVAQGCVPIGPTRVITEAKDNLITKLDGNAPLKALLEDLSAGDEEGLRQVLQSLHVALPIAHSDTGDYLVRNLASIDADKGHIAIGERVEPGQKMFFCQRDRAAATKDLTGMVQKLKARAGTIHGALYVSCCGRGPSIFESADAEVALVQQGLGDVPLIGFYANGEIAGDRIYGYTGVLALF